MKRLLSIVLALVMFAAVIPGFAADSETSFSDVAADDYYAAAANALVKAEILTGYEDGTFRPNGNITRAEMAAIICRVIGKEEVGSVKTATDFDDVEEDSWASGYIKVASDAGIINGDGNGSFRPDDDVTYEEAIKMVVCALGLADDIEANPSDWSKPYIDVAKANGITTSLKGSKGTASTRADVAVMTYNGICATIAAPVASVAAGSYTSTQSVTLTSATSGAVIYYTTDGTEPTTASTKYTKAISIAKTTTLKAVAVLDDVFAGSVTSVAYTVTVSSSGGGGGGGGSSSSSKTYTVKFNLNYDGAEDAPENQTVAKNGYAVKPTAPTRSDYVFVGWYTTASCTSEFDFVNDKITKNTTLYAGWVEMLNYAILDLEYDASNDIAEVECSAEGPATLRLTFKSEDETETIETVTYEITEECEVEVFDVPTDVSASLPDYYLIVADLLDEDDKKLCSSYTCMNYTSAFEEFMAKTVDDFDENLVINYDDNEDMNFGVLADDVIMLEGTDLINSELSDIDNYVYVIAQTDETSTIVVGDKILISEDNGYFITVESISESDGYYVIEGDSDAVLQDYYQYIKVDMEITADESNIDMSEADEGVTLLTEEEVDAIEDIFADDPEYVEEDTDDMETMAEMADVDQEVKTNIGFGLSFGTDHVKLNGSLTGELKLSLRIYYDLHIFSEDYFYFKTSVKVSLTAQATITATLEDDESADEVSDFATLGKVVFPFGITGLTSTVKLTFPLDWEISASGKASATVSAEIGFKYSTDDGYQPISKKSHSASAKIEGTARIAFGPKLEFSTEFIGEVLKLSISAYAGVEISCVAEIPLAQADSNGMVHLCRLCVDGTVQKFLKVQVKLTYKITNHLKGTPVNQTLVSFSDHLFDFYVSLINPSGSVKYGKGDCPFKSAAIGTLSGYVADAETSEFIPGAEIKLYIIDSVTQGQTYYNSVTTDEVGQYSLDLPTGDYLLDISAEGYISSHLNETISADETTYAETFLMVDGDPEEVGNIGGRIVNSVNGVYLADVEVNARYGWNQRTGTIEESTTTSSSGYYEMSLPLGNYTIQLIKDGYVTTYFNVVVTTSDRLNQGCSMVPEDSEEIPSGELRIVLYWGELPYDLDSHLVGPSADGTGRFHTAYYNKIYSENGITYADLDLDDVTSYGPETTTIYVQNDTGKYTYFVHDYSNKYSSSSYAMSNSGAYVEVYAGDTMVARYNVPANTLGTLWTVFQYDAETRTITSINTMTNESSPYVVGDDVAVMGLEDEDVDLDIDLVQEDLEMVLRDIEEYDKEVLN